MKGKKEKLSPEDAREYNFAKRKDKGKPLLDKAYNWIIERYSKHGNKFETSDIIVWSGAVYELPTWIGYIAFFSLFLWIAKIGFAKYGEARTVVFFMLLIMWRLQTQIGLLTSINKKF